MPKLEKSGMSIDEILKQVTGLRRALDNYQPAPGETTPESQEIRKFVGESSKLLSELREFQGNFI